MPIEPKSRKLSIHSIEYMLAEINKSPIIEIQSSFEGFQNDHKLATSVAQL